ncbi:thiolase family protein [Candidatus Kaiserbacteria bacterium]|nr:thiolase family protein [Candidatus Kaiserbacteria bacterium]
MKRSVYICDAVRTAHGSFCGSLKEHSSSELGAVVIRSLLERSNLPLDMVKGVFMGEVLTAGEGQNPARHAALQSGLPHTCPGETFNKVCASSLVALRHATHMIQLDEADCMIAGGMESMSRAPYLIRRGAKRMGDETLSSLYIKSGKESPREAYDSMVYDGLSEPSAEGRPHMGAVAEYCAAHFGITREAQEEYAIESFARANNAHSDGCFDTWMASVSGLYKDEGLRVADATKIKKMPPAFDKKGTITAATSAQIADGASGLLIADEPSVRHMGIEPIARICDFAVCSHGPNWYTTAPASATKKLLDSCGLKIDDIDLFEVNEAFAVVPLFAMRWLYIPREKMNVWGGSIAIGHPLGATGTRIVGQLAHQLVALKKKRGVAVACNGGGEAVAVLLERT